MSRLGLKSAEIFDRQLPPMIQSLLHNGFPPYKHTKNDGKNETKAKNGVAIVAAASATAAASAATSAAASTKDNNVTRCLKFPGFA